MEDQDIYELLLKRKQKGLKELLDKYGGLISYISKNIGILNEEDLSECISDILYAIWNKIDTFDESKASFKTWMVIVTRSCAIDHLRKNRKHLKIVSLDASQELNASDDIDMITDISMIDLLQELPPPDNEIFYRRYILGESPKEIAALLDMSQDSIYKRIQRGKDKLLDIMEKEGCCYG